MHFLHPVSAFPDSIAIEYRIANLYMGIVYIEVACPIWDYSLINLYFRHFTDKFVQNSDGAVKALAQAKLNLCHKLWTQD